MVASVVSKTPLLVLPLLLLGLACSLWSETREQCIERVNAHYNPLVDAQQQVVNEKWAAVTAAANALHDANAASKAAEKLVQLAQKAIDAEDRKHQVELAKARAIQNEAKRLAAIAAENQRHAGALPPLQQAKADAEANARQKRLAELAALLALDIATNAANAAQKVLDKLKFDWDAELKRCRDIPPVVHD